MAKKVQQTYAPFKITTPKLEITFPSLTEPDDFSGKYEIGVIVDDSPECRQMVNKLVTFQNECLEKDGHDPVDQPLNLKDEKAKNEATGKWEDKTGRQILFFKSAYRDKFDLVGPSKRPIDESAFTKGSIVRVNGSAAFGYMKGDPYLTLYLNAAQFIEGGGAGGVSAFDDESDGEDAPFENEESNDVVADLA